MLPKLSILCGLSLLGACALPPASSSAQTRQLSTASSSHSAIVSQESASSITLSAPAGTQVSINVYPYSDLGMPQGNVVASGSATAVASGGTSQATIKLKPLPVGYYQVTVQAGGSASVTSLAVLPQNVPKNTNEGVITHFAMGRGAVPRSLQMIRAAGFGWIRDEMYWNAIERQKGVYNFPASYDAYVNAAVQQGIQPLIVLDYMNKFYPYAPGQKGTGGLLTDGQRAGYAAYAKAVAARYRGRVDTFEIWNEPKPAAFGDPDWKGYTKMLMAAYPAIKSVNPSATVISCGGGGVGGGPGGDCPAAVIHNGGQAFEDAYSVHPYMAPFDPDKGYPVNNSPIGKSVSVQTVANHLHGFAKYHTRPDNAPLPMWVTEIGWYSSPVSYPNGEIMQGAYAVRTFVNARRFGLAQKVFWYDFQDDGTDSGNKEANFGMIRKDFSPKPAYIAVAVMHNELRDATFQSAPVDQPDMKVLSFRGAQGQVFVGWTVGQTPANVQVRVPNGNYIETDWQGKQTAVTVSGESLNWKVGPQPRYLTMR